MIQVHVPPRPSRTAITPAPHQPLPRQAALELLLIADRLCCFHRRRRHTAHDRQQLRAIRRELRSFLRAADACRECFSR